MATAFKTILIGSGGPRAKEGVIIETPSDVEFQDVKAGNTSNHLYYLDVSENDDIFGKINMSAYTADTLTADYTYGGIISRAKIILNEADDLYFVGRILVSSENAVSILKYDTAMSGSTSLKNRARIEHSSNAADATLQDAIYSESEDGVKVFYNPSGISGGAARTLDNDLENSHDHELCWASSPYFGYSEYRRSSGSAFYNAGFSFTSSSGSPYFLGFEIRDNNNSVTDFRRNMTTATVSSAHSGKNSVDTIFPDLGTSQTKTFAVSYYSAATGDFGVLVKCSAAITTVDAVKKITFGTFDLSPISGENEYPPVLRVINNKLYLMFSGSGPSDVRSNFIAKLDPYDLSVAWAYRLDHVSSAADPYNQSGSNEAVSIEGLQDGRIAFSANRMIFVVSEAGLPTGTYGGITISEDTMTLADITIATESYDATFGTLANFSYFDVNISGDTNTEGTETFTTEEIS